MNQWENGENEYESVLEIPPTKTLKQKLEIFDEKLRQLDETLGLDCTETSLDISGYLTMSRREIEALTPEVAARISHEISLSIFHIQKTINRNTARLNWCKSALSKVFGELARNYSHIYGWEEKKATMIYDNTYAEKLNDYIIEYQGRVDSLDGLTETLEGTMKSCKNMQYLKTSKERNY